MILGYFLLTTQVGFCSASGKHPANCYGTVFFQVGVVWISRPDPGGPQRTEDQDGERVPTDLGQVLGR